MKAYKSFIDLLFILLCGTIVLLTQSLQVGSLETAPAEAGGGAVSSINADDVRILVVDDQHITLDNTQYTQATQITQLVEPTQCLLILPAHESLSHHRVMHIWTELQQAGITVKLGVKPADEKTNS